MPAEAGTHDTLQHGVARPYVATADTDVPFRNVLARARMAGKKVLEECVAARLEAGGGEERMIVDEVFDLEDQLVRSARIEHDLYLPAALILASRRALSSS